MASDVSPRTEGRANGANATFRCWATNPYILWACWTCCFRARIVV